MDEKTRFVLLDMQFIIGITVGLLFMLVIADGPKNFLGVIRDCVKGEEGLAGRIGGWFIALGCSSFVLIVLALIVNGVLMHLPQ